MSILAIVLAIAAFLAALTAGYFFGAKKGVVARESLRQDVGELQAELRTSQADNGEDMGQLMDEFRLSMQRHESELQSHVSETLTSLTGSILTQQLSENEAQNTIQEQLDSLSKKIHSSVTMSSSLQSKYEARQLADQGALEERISKLLAPLTSLEQRKSTLAGLDLGKGDRTELPRLLDVIKSKGEFDGCLLIDEAGLPLAAAGSDDPETVGGLTAMILQLVDRFESAGQPIPMALTLRDENDRFTLYRVFTVRGDRYVITALSQGNPIPHNALDPVLGSVEKILSTEAWGSTPVRARVRV